MYSITIPCSIFSVSIIYLILAYIHIYPRKVFISKHNFSNHGQIIFFQKAETELDEKTLYLNVSKEEIEEATWRVIIITLTEGMAFLIKGTRCDVDVETFKTTFL